MDNGVLYFQKVRPDLDFMNEIFQFDARSLQELDSAKISQYCVALSQFVIFLKSEMNRTQSEINMKQRFVDSTVTMLLTSDMIKAHKTKTAAIDHIVSNSEGCMKAKEEIGALKDELMLIEGQDRNLVELVNAFKRELTRRENEYDSTRMGRR